MAERQIGYRKSSLVLSARLPVVKWGSRSFAKSAYYCARAHAFRVKRSERVFLGYVTEMLCMTKIGLERHRSGIRQMLYFLNKNMTTGELIWKNLTRPQSSLSLFFSLVARWVWLEGGKRVRESSSLFPSHHPLLSTRALGKDDWGRVSERITNRFVFNCLRQISVDDRLLEGRTKSSTQFLPADRKTGDHHAEGCTIFGCQQA